MVEATAVFGRRDSRLLVRFVGMLRTKKDAINKSLSQNCGGTTARGKRNDQGDETQPERHLCGRRVRVGPQKNNNLFGLECQHNTYILKPIIYVQLPSQ